MTRASVVRAARRQFLSAGYGATTIGSIAAEAGVSTETIYKAFTNKPGLVRAIHEEALAGGGSVSAETRSDAMRDQVGDPREVIRNWAGFTSEVMPRVAPILLLVRSGASSAPALAALWDELEERRLGRMAQHAAHFERRGDLRPDITRDQARDVLWAYTSPEFYERLVVQQEWPLGRYSEFVAEGIIAALLPPPLPQHR